MDNESMINKLGEIVAQKMAHLQGELDAYASLKGETLTDFYLASRLDEPTSDPTSYNDWEYQRGYREGLERAQYWVKHLREIKG